MPSYMLRYVQNRAKSCAGDDGGGDCLWRGGDLWPQLWQEMSHQLRHQLCVCPGGGVRRELQEGQDFVWESLLHLISPGTCQYYWIIQSITTTNQKLHTLHQSTVQWCLIVQSTNEFTHVFLGLLHRVRAPCLQWDCGGLQDPCSQGELLLMEKMSLKTFSNNLSK